MKTSTILLIFVIALIFLYSSKIKKESFMVIPNRYNHNYDKHEYCKRCNNFYLGNRCLSPYCNQEWWWYNEHTPLPWGNTSRTPKWFWPPYTYITRYYNDYY